MRASFLLIFFLIVSIHARAQSEKPLEKIEYHFDLCKKYRRTDQEKRIWHARKALYLAEKYQQKKERGKALGEIGRYYKNQSKLDSAYYYYDSALRQFKRNKDNVNYSVVLFEISNVLEREGKLIESFKLLVKADSIYQKQGNAKDLIGKRTSILVALSINLMKRKEFQKAIWYLKKAEKLEGNSIKNKAIIYNSLVGWLLQQDEKV